MVSITQLAPHRRIRRRRGHACGGHAHHRLCNTPNNNRQQTHQQGEGGEGEDPLEAKRPRLAARRRGRAGRRGWRWAVCRGREGDDDSSWGARARISPTAAGGSSATPVVLDGAGGGQVPAGMKRGSWLQGRGGCGARPAPQSWGPGGKRAKGKDSARRHPTTEGGGLGRSLARLLLCWSDGAYVVCVCV